MNPFSGDQIVQVTNPDPFARPVLRSPVLHTPVWMIAIAQAARLLWRLARFVARHPVATLLTAVLAVAWRYLNWPGPLVLVIVLTAGAAAWRYILPASWSRLVGSPVRGRWRRWRYQRQWVQVMTVARLAVPSRTHLLVPVLGPVTATRFTDRLLVRMVAGQSPEDFDRHASNIAHGLGALTCRIRSARPGHVIVELVRCDALTAIIPALPVPGLCDLRSVPVGRREDGHPWTVRLRGTHVLVAGSTGAGKASLLWGIIRGIVPALENGTAHLLGADPKLMELAYGQPLFERYGRYESDPAAITDMLEDAVTGMQSRAAQLAGRSRDHRPTTQHPFTLIVIDEVAFLTAYQPDKKLRERTLHALATLTTQGRAVGYCVLAALQDPRKDVLTIRNLFPDRIAMRLDEPEQVDMVLGDGTRDRGALADTIPADPDTGAGIAYVRLADDPDPVRVRAAWVADHDITAMCRDHAPARPALILTEPGEAA
jgi:S-DNA-T family DNA segregation ATPase FtsK/SpoIIIE